MATTGDTPIAIKDRDFKSTGSWRCCVKDCKGQLSATGDPTDGDEPIKTSGAHCHIPDPAVPKIKKLHGVVA